MQEVFGWPVSYDENSSIVLRCRRKKRDNQQNTEIFNEKGIFKKMEQLDQQQSNLPPELSQPARRALAGAGYWRLEQLTGARSAEIKQLHGVGPKALAQLHHALEKRGLSFADEKK